jgi:hypothetical protein
MFVIPVVIDPVEGMVSAWFATDVEKEGPKAFELGCNNDPSSAVILVVTRMKAFASISHISPCFVFAEVG